MKDGELKNKLSPAQISVMRHKVTEPPYFGRFWDHFEPGTYRCAACSTPLFNSDDKFDLKTGWPTFKKPINEKDLQFKSEPGPDDKVEIRCKKCKSHLGYVIPNDPPYYRVNSVCLTFEVTKPTDIVPVVAPALATVPMAAAVPEPHVSRDDVPEKGRGALFLALTSGAVIGLIVGGASVWLYLDTLDASSATINAATTTDMIATSSVDVSTENEPAAAGNPSPETKPPADVPPENLSDPSIQGFESPTSTQ